MRSFSRRFRLLVWLVYWASVAVLTHLPPGGVPRPAIPQADKAAHFAIFFGLTLLGGWYLAAGHPARRSAAMVGMWVLLAVYALLDELTQPLTGRTASVADVIADFLGIAAAMWLLWRRKSTPQARPSEPRASQE